MSKPQFAATQVLAFLPPQVLDLPTCTAEAPTFIPPCEIVWIPVGATVISAGGGVDGEGFNGEVVCDEAAFNNIAASFAEMTSAGRRVWIDFDHEDGEAAAWVIAFRWDATRGIIAAVEWTNCGCDALEGKSFYSFSPAFLIDPETSRPLSLIPGHAAGGLVNAPAFGARMPALIAARLGSLPLSPSTGKTASGGSPDSKNTATTMSTTATPPAAAAVKAAEEPTLKDVLAAIEGVSTRVAALEGDDEKDEAKKKKEAEEVAARERTASAPAGSPLPAVVQAKDAAKVVVVTAALADVLKGYGSEKDSLKRGIIFARDFAPRYKKDFNGHEVMQVLAANSIGSLAGDLIAQQSLSLLKLEFPMLGRVTTDFSNLNAQFGQTIKTRTRSVPSVGTYTDADGYVSESAATADVPITINQHKFVEIPFSVNELASTARNLFDEQIEGTHYALGLDMVTALYALIVNGTFGNKTTQASTTITARNDIQKMRGELNKRGVPKRIRTLLLNSDAVTALFSDSGLLNLAAYQRPDFIEKGMMVDVAGFGIFEAPNLITTGNQTGFGFSPDALVIASRVPNDYTSILPGAAYGNVSTITNPDTGLSVQSVQYVDHKAGKTSWRVALMYGVAPGQTDSGQRLVSA